MSEDALTAALSAHLGEAAVEVEEKPPVAEVDEAAAPEAAQEEGSDDDLKLLADAEFAEARAKGWDPDKDAYEARTGKTWVPAGEFLRKRGMADEISRRGKEIKQLKRQIDQLTSDFKKRVEDEVKTRMDALKKERADAIREQDFERIDELDNEIDALKERKTVEPAPDGADEPDNLFYESPEAVALIVNEWKKTEAPWFDKAPKPIRDAALKAERAYRQANEGCSTKEALDFVADHMRRRYPELEAYGRKAPSASSPRGTTRSGPVVDESKLSEADRKILRQMTFKDDKERREFVKDLLEGAA